jgi:hypothetical protein
MKSAHAAPATRIRGRLSLLAEPDGVEYGVVLDIRVI